MSETSSDANSQKNASNPVEPKWDYTNRRQTLLTGALVVGLNLLLVIGVILDRTIPAVHSFITGKPM